jgi:cytochrome c-type protein NapB
MKLKLSILGAVTAMLLVAGCSSGTPQNSETKASAPQAVSEESLGLRKTTLYSEADTTGDKTEYSKAVAGSGKTINRAFQDAPPMIPHDVSDYLPITTNNNACTGCHMPEVASAMNATPIPKSHFVDMRPKHQYDGKEFKRSVDHFKSETVLKDKDALVQARFNCSQCHAPQSQGKLVVENTFQPDFTTADGAKKSNWYDTINDGLDTIGEGGEVTEADIANKNSVAGSLK